MVSATWNFGEGQPKVTNLPAVVERGRLPPILAGSETPAVRKRVEEFY
jgi:hypothetical protein